MAGDADDTDAAVFPGFTPKIKDGKYNDQDGANLEYNTAPVADAESFDMIENGTLTVASVPGAVHGMVTSGRTRLTVSRMIYSLKTLIYIDQTASTPTFGEPLSDGGGWRSGPSSAPSYFKPKTEGC